MGMYLKQWITNSNHQPTIGLQYVHAKASAASTLRLGKPCHGQPELGIPTMATKVVFHEAALSGTGFSSRCVMKDSEKAKIYCFPTIFKRFRGNKKHSQQSPQIFEAKNTWFSHFSLNSSSITGEDLGVFSPCGLVQAARYSEPSGQRKVPSPDFLPSS